MLLNNGIADLMDVSLSELRELVMDREAWRAAIHGVTKSRTWLSDWSERASKEKAMATHSSTLAWQIPWMEEPGRVQSMGSWRVGYDWATSLSLFTFIHWKRKWQTTPVFLPGKSHGQRSLVGYCPWGRKELDTTEQQHFYIGLPDISDGKESACNVGNQGSIPGLGRSPEEGKGYPSSILAWRIPWTI